MKSSRSLIKSILPAAILAVLSLHAHAVASSTILLDNTNGLSTTGMTNSLQTLWGSNATAYNRINGYTFKVGATGYGVTSISVSLVWTGSGTITPNMRINVWELPSLTATAPASNSLPFYTLDDSSHTLSSTQQFSTFSIPANALNLKANTVYSMGFLTDQTTNSAGLSWKGYSPSAGQPSGSAGLTSLSSSLFYSINGGSSFVGGTSMTYGFQLTGIASVPEPTVPLFTALTLCAGLLQRRRSSHSL